MPTTMDENWIDSQARNEVMSLSDQRYKAGKPFTVAEQQKLLKISKARYRDALSKRLREANGGNLMPPAQ
jgi:hypothetical protein